MKLREFVQATGLMVSRLDNTNWTQSIGCYEPGKSCCIGAHLAHWFHKETGKPIDYITGEQEAAKFLGCTQGQLRWMLHAAGAPKYPFGMDPWELHPFEVWKNLLLIETLPPDVSGDCVSFYSEQQAVETWLQEQRKRIHEAQRVRPGHLAHSGRAQQHQLGPAHR